MREYGVVGHTRPSVHYLNGRQEGKGKRDDGVLRACGVPFRRGEILGRVDEHAVMLAGGRVGLTQGGGSPLCDRSQRKASSVSLDAFS